jgi:hypothetical protein
MVQWYHTRLACGRPRVQSPVCSFRLLQTRVHPAKDFRAVAATWWKQWNMRLALAAQRTAVCCSGPRHVAICLFAVCCLSPPVCLFVCPPTGQSHVGNEARSNFLRCVVALRKRNSACSASGRAHAAVQNACRPAAPRNTGGISGPLAQRKRSRHGRHCSQPWDELRLGQHVLAAALPQRSACARRPARGCFGS